MNYQQMVQSLYTKRIRLYNIFVQLSGYQQAIKKFFSQSHYLLSSMHILDAGCGTGLVTKILHNLASHKNLTNSFFYGFDLTPAMLNHFYNWINKKKKTQITLLQADILNPEQLPPDWNNFNLIIVSGMLEYIPPKNVGTAISNLKNMLAPGGTFLIFISKYNWFNCWLIGKWWKAYLYTETEMKTIMHNRGFTQFSFKKFPFPYQYLNRCLHIIEAKK